MIHSVLGRIYYHSSRAASSSARCIARTADLFRVSLPPICIKQLASPEITALTPALSIASILLSRIATEISGYLTENVPPKPQQESAFGSSINFRSAHVANQPARLTVHVQIAQPV